MGNQVIDEHAAKVGDMSWLFIICTAAAYRVWRMFQAGGRSVTYVDCGRCDLRHECSALLLFHSAGGGFPPRRRFVMTPGNEYPEELLERVN